MHVSHHGVISGMTRSACTSLHVLSFKKKFFLRVNRKLHCEAVQSWKELQLYSGLAFRLIGLFTYFSCSGHSLAISEEIKKSILKDH